MWGNGYIQKVITGVACNATIVARETIPWMCLVHHKYSVIDIHLAKLASGIHSTRQMVGPSTMESRLQTKMP